MTGADDSPAAPPLATDAELALSLEEAADFFDVSTPTVRDWIKAGAPIVEGGKPGVAYRIDPRALAAWRKDRLDGEAAERERRQGTLNQLRLDLLGPASLTAQDGDATLSKTEAAAALAAEYHRTKLAEKRGELVNATALKLLLAQAFANLQASLRAMPDTVCRQLGLGEDVAGEMLEHVDDFLRDLGRELAALNLDERTDAAGDGEAGQLPLA